MQNKLSVSECVRFGWETFKKRPWFLIGALLILLVIDVVNSSISNAVDDSRVLFAIIVFGIISFVISIAVGIATIKISLKAHDSIDTVRFADGLPPRPFWKYFFTTLITGLASVAAGGVVMIPYLIITSMLGAPFFVGAFFWLSVVAAVIAALYVSIVLFFAPYIVIDRSTGVTDALNESRRITEGNVGKLALLLLAFLGLNLLGVIALIVGLLVTIPVTMLAMVHAYRTLEHKANEVAPMTPVTPVTPTASVA